MKLALSLPWSNTAGNITIDPKYIPTEPKFAAGGFKIADAINSLSEVALYVGGFMMFFWAVWGVFDYLRAEGNKEALAKARKRIQWAIAGFIILLMAFFVSDALQNILIRDSNSLYDLRTRGITPVPTP